MEGSGSFDGYELVSSTLQYFDTLLIKSLSPLSPQSMEGFPLRRAIL